MSRKARSTIDLNSQMSLIDKSNSVYYVQSEN